MALNFSKEIDYLPLPLSVHYHLFVFSIYYKPLHLTYLKQFFNYLLPCYLCLKELHINNALGSPSNYATVLHLYS